MTASFWGDSHGGNISISLVGSSGSRIPLEGNLAVDLSLDGLLAAYFFGWEARRIGSFWHGFYNVPETLIFSDNQLQDIVGVSLSMGFAGV